MLTKEKQKGGRGKKDFGIYVSVNFKLRRLKIIKERRKLLSFVR
jgi:hypothetical protein